VTDVAAGVAGPYRRLLAEPVLRRLALADVSARLPQGMMSLTLLLVAAQHASMAVAGLVLAGYTLGAAATAPVRGRLADRRGLFWVSAVCAAGYVLALLGLLAASLARTPAGLMISAAAAAGLLMPPLSPGVRNLWSVYAAAGLRQTAFALDAAVFDLSYLVGPVLASTLAAGLAPAAALGVVLVLTGTAVAAVSPHSRPPEGREERAGRPRPRPLRSAALRRLLVTAALTNAALSATEVALTAYTRDHHALWASGPLLAAVSAGSITGSLLLGARPARAGARAPEPRLGRLLAGYALGLAGLTAAGLYAPLLAIAAPVAGLCLGPALATLFSAAGAAAPPGTGTEAQAWINSIMNGGAAGGAALASLAAGRPVLGLALAAGAAAAAAASTVSTRIVAKPA
jgi:MFS family permease